MLFDITVTQFSKMLINLSSILDKSASFAEAKKIDVEVLLNSRLAPDQFNLIRQVQIACDTAKLAVARLTGNTDNAPKHEDNEKNLGELQARIKSVIEYISQFSSKDFEKAAEIRISQPRWQGKSMSGYDFTVQHAVPNLYFHITTAYSILRHNGVDVGKKDYLGELSFSS